MVNALNRPLNRLLFLVGVLFASAVAAESAAVRLYVEPDPPRAGESFTLAFETDGKVDAEPDFGPLAADFEILDRAQQTSLQIVNGKSSRSTVWRLQVLPKHDGPLRVPALRFGRLRSPARDLEFASGPAATKDDDGLFLEVDAEPRKPYVQQQVIYRLRLWKRYEISNASLSEPELTADAIVKPLDADRRYEDTRNGKRYEVIERKFAVFPQTSGKVTIKPAVVTAQVVKRGFSLFDAFGQPVTTKRLVSPAVDLEVRPIPAAFPDGATWLPARQLNLHAEWEPDTGEVRIGEPVTRTLDLWVDGLTAGQLPPLDTESIAGVKQYPDQPQVSEQQSASGYSAVLQRKTALLPTAPGRLTLPAVEVPWWNTETERLEIARVPSREIVTVAGAQPPVSAPAPSAPAIAADAPRAASAGETPPPAAAPPADGYWRILAAIALAGWALTLLLWWSRARARPAPPAAAPDAPAPAPSAAAVDAAIARGDPHALAATLLRWAAARWPEAAPRSLGALAARAPADCAAALWALDAALYRADAPAPDLARLREAWHAWTRAERTASRRERPAALPPLYAPR